MQDLWPLLGLAASGGVWTMRDVARSLSPTPRPFDHAGRDEMRNLLTRNPNRVPCRDGYGHRCSLSVLPRRGAPGVRLRTPAGDLCLSRREAVCLRRAMAAVISEQISGGAADCHDEFGFHCAISIASRPDGAGLRLRSVLGDLYLTPLRVGRIRHLLAKVIRECEHAPATVMGVAA